VFDAMRDLDAQMTLPGERPVYDEGRIHLMARQCDTCIFRAGNLMHLEPGRVEAMVAGTREVEGGHIPCHETILGQADQRAICRGWWNRHAMEHWLFRLAVGQGVVEEVG
jgi:hypothetical protein